MQNEDAAAQDAKFWLDKAAEIAQTLQNVTKERDELRDKLSFAQAQVRAFQRAAEAGVERQARDAAIRQRDEARAELSKAIGELKELQDFLERAREGVSRDEDEICQVLGKALGYPWYKDDPEIFPNATEEHGVCVGEHVAATIAAEAARVIGELKAKVEELSWKPIETAPRDETRIMVIDINGWVSTWNSKVYWEGNGNMLPGHINTPGTHWMKIRPVTL